MIVVMGVSGAGKSVVGAALAAALGVAFGEGDAFHPAANVAKMAAGTPLTDADRAPWLAAVADWMAAHPQAVVACSALKRAYRDRLRQGVPGACFVLLAVPPTQLRQRVRDRRGHFMPPALLDSQLATLEPFGADEHAVAIDARGSIADEVAAIRAWLAQAGPCA